MLVSELEKNAEHRIKKPKAVNSQLNGMSSKEEVNLLKVNWKPIVAKMRGFGKQELRVSSEFLLSCYTADMQLL